MKTKIQQKLVIHYKLLSLFKSISMLFGSSSWIIFPFQKKKKRETFLISWIMLKKPVKEKNGTENGGGTLDEVEGMVGAETVGPGRLGFDIKGGDLTCPSPEKLKAKGRTHKTQTTCYHEALILYAFVLAEMHFLCFVAEVWDGHEVIVIP